MRRFKYHKWLGNLMIFSLLFTQSVSLWAMTLEPAHNQHFNQRHIDQQTAGQQQVIMTSSHDCCQHAHSSMNFCLSACALSGIFIMQGMQASALPAYRLVHSVQFLSGVPEGMHAGVLERPPRHFS